MEKQRVVLRDGLLPFFQKREVAFDEFAAGILVVNLGSDHFKPVLCFFVPGGQILVFLVVIRLILHDVGVLVDAVLNESGDHVQLIGESIAFRLELRGVKDCVPDELEGFEDGFLVGEGLVCGAHESVLNLVVGQMRRGAFLAVVFVIALPDDFPVFVRALPDLGAVPAATLDAFDFAGEVVYAAVAVPARTAFLKLNLHLIENIRINDGLMVALDVVLRNLALVDLRFLRQVIDGLSFLQQGVAFVFLVLEDALDCGSVPLGVVVRDNYKRLGRL